jgi:hypothetical protein
MKIKIVFLLVISCLMFINTSFSQVSVGFKTGVRDGEGKFKPEDLASLKNTTMVFILPSDAELSDVKVYEKVFSEVWKYTPYKVITDDQIKTLEKGKSYSYLIIEGVSVSYNTYCFYELLMFNGKKEKIFAQIRVDGNYCDDKKFKGKTPENMGAGYLKTYLNIINSYLSEERILKLDETSIDNSTLKNLATETLYVPEEYLHYTSNWGGKLKDIPEAEFFAKYPYPHKVATTKEINELLLTSDKPIYFVGPSFYYKGDRINCIYSSQSTEPVYYVTDGSTPVDASVMKSIAKKIKSALEK